MASEKIETSIGDSISRRAPRKRPLIMVKDGDSSTDDRLMIASSSSTTATTSSSVMPSSSNTSSVPNISPTSSILGAYAAATDTSYRW
jgi:hypothetical protein